MKSLKGAALPTVMVISILISLLVLFAIALFDINLLYYSIYHNSKQSKEDLNSAFVLYCNDSTFLSSYKEKQEYKLYEDRASSIVHLEVRPWGLYECVTFSLLNDKFQSSRFLGKSQECNHEAALWVCSRNTVLSLAGETTITGKAFIPVNGISYIRLGDTPFEGREIDDYNIDLAERELPPIDSSYVAAFEQLAQQKDISPLPLANEIKPYYSFKDETSYFRLPTVVDELQIRGNAVLYADEVTLFSETKLNDVILIARKVTIEEGFIGALQIVASDTVIIQDNVKLGYPSGVYLKGNKGKTYLSLGKDSRLSGYAIIFGDVNGSLGLQINNSYSQDSTAIFDGLLYVDGIADIRGELSGAVYLKECYYLPHNGIYVGTMKDAKVYRNDKMGYPFFFSESTYSRREIKTVN